VAKITQEPRPALYPVPAVMVSCVGRDGKPNIITIAWTGVVCSTPPMVSIAVRHGRHSFGLIRDTGDFVINIPKQDDVKAADLCGTLSGRDVDKFKEVGLTAIPADKVKSPLIKECPVNLECVVRHSLFLGSHQLFVGEVVALHVDEEHIDKQGRWDVGSLRPMAYFSGEYWTLGKPVGRQGFARKG